MNAITGAIEPWSTVVPAQSKMIALMGPAGRCARWLRLIVCITE